MQTVDEKPETIHLYVVREGQKRPSLIPVIISLFALSVLLAFCALVPYQQPVIRKTIRVPAVPLPPVTLTVTEPIVASGIKAYPATSATGTLTLTNGSVIAQELPAGLLFAGRDGVGVVTDAPAYVPAGSATGYGYATVPANATTPGKAGNIPALDINSVEGGSLYIRNLAPFTGGKDAWTEKYITPKDKQAALAAGTASLQRQAHRIKAILASTSSQAIYSGARLRLTLLCRFIAYPKLPGFRITGIRIEGRELLVNVAYTLRPRPFTGK
jgi:Baseplate J-like protein